jgi:hypothetical protein
MFFETLPDYGDVCTGKIIPGPEIMVGTLNVANEPCFGNLNELIAV